jgi:hypothetical protein
MAVSELMKERAERRYHDTKVERRCRMVALVECWQNLGNYAALVKLATEVMNDPTSPDELCEETQAYAFGKLEEAETAFRQALARLNEAQEWREGAMSDAGRVC